MLSEEPQYNDGNLDIHNVDLKIVDFGIFGSISGIRMENITAGSLKYMSPELFQGKTESSTQIDIWSIGLILHAMVIGWLPFNKKERTDLEKQICTEHLDYLRLKRIKNHTIKDEYRKQLNSRLKRISDNCLDLLMKMLDKDPAKRIELIDIFEHPWIVDHKEKNYNYECSSSELSNSDPDNVTDSQEKTP